MYKGGVNEYENHDVFYSEDLHINPSAVPYTKDQFESRFDIVPSEINVLAYNQYGLSYEYSATGLSNYFELCYIINRMAHFPACSEVYMHPITAPGPIQPTLLGDANNDGLVNIEDILFTRNLIFDDTDTRISEKGYTNILFEEPITVNSILLIRDAIFDTQQ